jgi:pyruvate,water dikinase
MSLFGFLKRENACRLLADPGDTASRKYRQFKELLTRNDEVLDGLAALEQAYYGGEMFTPGAAREACLRMGKAVEGMAASLDELAAGRYPGMLEALARIMNQALKALKPGQPAPDGPLTAALSQLRPDESALAWPDWAGLAGGKAFNLARVRNETSIPVPDGFVVTTAGFAAFMNHGGVSGFAAAELEPVSPLDLPGLEERCARVRERILSAPFPEALSRDLAQRLEALARTEGGNTLLAVRSSARGEDGPASFAGQYDSVLNVSFEDVEQACRQVFASKYTPRALIYRLRMGLDDADTPMAALVLPMVEAKASGVLYTLAPGTSGNMGAPAMRVDAVTGLADKLVSGEAAPAEYVLARDPLAVAHRPDTGPADGPDILDDASLLALGRAGLALEELFGSPQDVEWCRDATGRILVVQSRPLGALVLDPEPEDSPPLEADPDKHPVILAGGVTASRGAACGEIVRVDTASLPDVPAGAILAAKNAAPELAALLDRAAGVVTELGGAASHLASVAREMGVPALFGLAGCMDVLPQGRQVTLDATGRRVLQGCEWDLTEHRSRPASRVIGSPMHKRLRAALDLIAPLTLTDPKAPNFNPQGCETLHDLVRFAHETAMRAMFGMCDSAGGDGLAVARLKAKIPLILYCLDLGGGLTPNLTTCDDITPKDLLSTPMRAIWQGFTHPGITWSGTIAFDPRSFMTLLAASATAEVDGGAPGGDSYAMLGADYVNLSARFGYHFANVDAFCSGDTAKNHVTLRFAGGAGGYSGKCLRVGFLARVLSRLGFTVDASGDVLDASFKGAPAEATRDVLDHLGRLLACSRLLDMAITSQADVEAMSEAFLKGDYDLLARRKKSPLPGFHLTEGDWELLEEDGEPMARQDGSKWAPALSRGFAGLMGRVAGQRYQRFLDSVGAYFHFPLAVAKDSAMGEGRASVMARPVAGNIDRAAGLAFAVRSAGTYLVLRVNALEDNVILFEFTDGERRELESAPLPVASGQWTELAVEVAGGRVTGFVDGNPVLSHRFDETPQGLLGLWTKADSVSDFAGLTRTNKDGERRFPM